MSWKSTNLKSGISYAERLRLANSQNQSQVQDQIPSQSQGQHQDQRQDINNQIPASQSDSIPTSTSGNGNGGKQQLYQTPPPPPSSTSDPKASNHQAQATISSSTEKATTITSSSPSSNPSISSPPKSIETSISTKPIKNPWTERKLKLEQRNQNRLQLEQENRNAEKAKMKEKEEGKEVVSSEKQSEENEKPLLALEEKLDPNGGDSRLKSSSLGNQERKGVNNSKVDKVKSWADVASKNQKKPSNPSTVTNSTTHTSPSQGDSRTLDSRKDPSLKIDEKSENSTTPPNSIPTSTSTSSSIRIQSQENRALTDDHTSTDAASKSVKTAGTGIGTNGTNATRRRNRRRSKSSSSGSLNFSSKNSPLSSSERLLDEGGEGKEEEGENERRLDSQDWPEVSDSPNRQRKEKGLGGGKRKEEAPSISNEKDVMKQGKESELELEDEIKKLDVKTSGKERKDKNGKSWISIVPELSVSADSSSNGTHSGSGSGSGSGNGVRRNRNHKMDYSSDADHQEAVKRKLRLASSSSSTSNATKSTSNGISAAMSKTGNQIVGKGSQVGDGIKGDQSRQQARDLFRQEQPPQNQPGSSDPEGRILTSDSDHNLHAESQAEMEQSQYPPPASSSSHQSSQQSQVQNPAYPIPSFYNYSNPSSEASVPLDTSYDPSIVQSVPTTGSYYHVHDAQFWNGGSRGGGSFKRGGNGRGRGRGRGRFAGNHGSSMDQYSNSRMMGNQFYVDSRLSEAHRHQDHQEYEYMPHNQMATFQGNHYPMNENPIHYYNSINETSNQISDAPHSITSSNSNSTPMATSPTHALLNQIEFYFSQRNLQGDFYLRNQMDPYGFVPISVVSNFNRVRKLTDDLDLVRNTLLYSQVLQVSMDGLSVRKKWGWEEFVMHRDAADGNGNGHGHYHPESQMGYSNPYPTDYQVSSASNGLPSQFQPHQTQGFDYQSSIGHYPPPFQNHQQGFENLTPNHRLNHNHQYQQQLSQHQQQFSQHSQQLSHQHQQQAQSQTQTQTFPSSSSISSFSAPQQPLNEISSATTPTTTHEDTQSKTSVFSSPPSTFSLSRNSDEENVTNDEDDDVLESKDDDETLGVVAAEGLGGLVG